MNEAATIPERKTPPGTGAFYGNGICFDGLTESLRESIVNSNIPSSLSRLSGGRISTAAPVWMGRYSGILQSDMTETNLILGSETAKHRWKRDRECQEPLGVSATVLTPAKGWATVPELPLPRNENKNPTSYLTISKGSAAA